MSASPAVQRLTHLLSASNDPGRPVIDEAVDTDLREVLDLVERLGQTIAALPDAMANGAANLAHARAQRDRLAAENRRLHEALDYQASIVGRVEEVAAWGLPVGPEVLRVALDPARSLQGAEEAAHAAAEESAGPTQAAVDAAWREFVPEDVRRNLAVRRLRGEAGS